MTCCVCGSIFALVVVVVVVFGLDNAVATHHVWVVELKVALGVIVRVALLVAASCGATPQAILFLVTLTAMLLHRLLAARNGKCKKVTRLGINMP